MDSMNAEDEIRYALAIREGKAAEERISNGENTRELQRLKRQGHLAREAFVSAWMPLAHKMANRLRHVDHDDAFQEAMFQVTKCVDKFDPDKGYRFSTYVVPSVRGHLIRWSSQTHQIRVPAGKTGYMAQVVTITEDAEARGQCPPSADELAALLGCTPEVAADLQAVPTVVGGAEPWFVPSVDEGYERVEHQAVAACLADCLYELTEREAEAVSLLYAVDPPLSIREVAEQFGCCRKSVQNLRDSAFSKLRHPIILVKLRRGEAV